MSDVNKIYKQLIQIKGVGNWTIDMFLIFSKNNLDIFPEGDLALINVIKKKYQVDSMNQILEIGGPEVVTYREMMHAYTKVAGLRRRVILPVPVLTPRLSSHWVNLVCLLYTSPSPRDS